jgi:hypothetical protein
MGRAVNACLSRFTEVLVGPRAVLIGCKEISAQPEFDPRTAQPVVSITLPRHALDK